MTDLVTNITSTPATATTPMVGNSPSNEASAKGSGGEGGRRGAKKNSAENTKPPSEPKAEKKGNPPAPKNRLDLPPDLSSIRRCIEPADVILNAVSSVEVARAKAEQGAAFVLQQRGSPLAIYGRGDRHPKSHNDADSSNAGNLSYGEQCRIPIDHDSLQAVFRFKVLPIAEAGDHCSDYKWNLVMHTLLNEFRDQVVNDREATPELIPLLAFKPEKGKTQWDALPGEKVVPFPGAATELAVAPKQRPQSDAELFCNDPDQRRQRIAGTREAVQHIARCSAYSMVTGLWLWRNRDDADDITIEISYGDYATPEEKWTRFCVSGVKQWPKYPVVTPAQRLAQMPDPVTEVPLEGKDLADFDAFAAALAKAFLAGGPAPGSKSPLPLTPPLHVKVVAHAKMFPGQPMWPSQRYLPKRETIPTDKEGEVQPVSRLFLRIHGHPELPAISSQKVMNALRTYDNMHGNPLFPHEIVPVEPNGSSLRLGMNLREDADKNSYWDVLLRWIGCNVLSRDDYIYLMGCFIRGGVFGVKRPSETKDPKVASDDKSGTDAEASQKAAA